MFRRFVSLNFSILDESTGYHIDTLFLGDELLLPNFSFYHAF